MARKCPHGFPVGLGKFPKKLIIGEGWGGQWQEKCYSKFYKRKIRYNPLTNFFVSKFQIF